MARLDVRDVSVRFGGHLAVDTVDLQAHAGEITGLIGPNGAGKTTLFNVITGLLAPTAGSVAIEGRDVTRMPPHRRARLGLARTFQRLELFSLLSVRENILVAADVRRSWSRERVDLAAEAERLIDWVGLRECADERVDALPTGRARLVELARALATQPTILLLDEPASGLDDHETDEFAALLRRLADTGVAVVLVEHDVRLVMGVCDRIHVLDFGAVIAVGRPDEIRNDPAVLAAYLGAGPAPADHGPGTNGHGPGGHA